MFVTNLAREMAKLVRMRKATNKTKSLSLSLLSFLSVNHREEENNKRKGKRKKKKKKKNKKNSVRGLPGKARRVTILGVNGTESRRRLEGIKGVWSTSGNQKVEPHRLITVSHG